MSGPAVLLRRRHLSRHHLYRAHASTGLLGRLRLPHPARHHLHDHHHHDRVAAVLIAVGVIVTNVAVITVVLGLRDTPASPADQVRSVIAAQVAALDAHDVDGLRSTMCPAEEAAAPAVIAALPQLGARNHLRVVSVDQISITGDTATARVVLALTGAPQAALRIPADGAITTFTREDTGWTVCGSGHSLLQV